MALQAYDQVRRPFSQDVAARSDTTGKTAHLKRPEWLADLTEEQSASGTALTHEQLEQVGIAMERAADWRNATTVEEETQRAFRTLDEALLSRA